MELSWIKISTNIFDDEKIMLIESMPEGDAIIVIWFKLLALAGKSNNNGIFMISDKIPYTDEMLATIFRRNINTIRLALSVFEQFGMIEVINNVVTLPNWDKYQNIDGMEKIREQTKLRVQKHREKQKHTIEESNEKTENVTLPLRYVTQQNKNKNKNILYSEEVTNLTLYLYNECKKDNPKFSKTENEIAKWKDAFDKLNRLDGYSFDEIMRVLVWAKNDSFWRMNILSGVKFREKFEQLYIKSKNKQTNMINQSKPKPSTSGIIGCMQSQDDRDRIMELINGN